MGAAEVPQGTRRPGGWGRVTRAASMLLSPACRGRAQRRTAQRRLGRAVPHRCHRSALEPPEQRHLDEGTALRPIPQFTTVTERTREGLVNYDSMQVTANHRLSGGLAFGTAYTVSTTKSMGVANNGALTGYLDPRERLYAYDNNDRRHIFSYQGSWNVPDGSALWHSAVGRALLDGWQLAGVGFWRSGTPTTVTYTTTDAGGGDTIGGGDPVRVSMVSGCDPILSRGERSEERWFDTSCFIRTPVGSYGDSPVNNIRQPGNYNLDLSMSKTFALGRGQRLMFRADAYNALKVDTRTVNIAAQFDPQGRQSTRTSDGSRCLLTKRARSNCR